MTAYTRGMSTEETKTTAANKTCTVVRTEGGDSPSAPTWTEAGPTNTAGHSTRPAPPQPAYNPLALLKALLALLGLLLGLTLALGGWQPHTSDARLGWSTGSINVVEGTDGDTGSRPLSPHDEGVLPAPDTLSKVDTVNTQTGSEPSPVDHWETFFEGAGPGGASIAPWSGGSRA